MPVLNRRQFLASSSGIAFASAEGGDPPVDFRYSPLSWQTAICFPDDPHKSLVGQTGDLRYGYVKAGIAAFRTVVGFSLGGMEQSGPVKQWLEAPEAPIVHTRMEWPNAVLELTAFATNRQGEGRVDNVIAEVRPKSSTELRAAVKVTVRTRSGVTVKGQSVEISNVPFLAAGFALSRPVDAGSGWEFSTPSGVAAPGNPARWLFRFPQAGQTVTVSGTGEDLLAEARQYWREWKPLAGPVGWRAPGRYGEFLTACARNILQAREIRDGRLTFQVGPTVYRGLWVVDGNFILEAARYLGYDAEAQRGLEATWAQQDKDGGVYAGAGASHWKDTGIAMFSLARQAELSQDWTYFRKMRPQILLAVDHLRKLREKAAAEGSACGKYGLLPRGMGDGGLGGIRSEFTNTLWVLAGLKATAQAARAQKVSGLETVEVLYQELHANCVQAIRQEMRRHPQGFEYLPMLMKEDAQWNAPQEWSRPRPQSGQWALSHAIYPGLLFEKDDPVVQGHIRLMRACTQEDIPAETGWAAHEGVWNYNACFVAQVYLWAGMRNWARSTFHGFLNHASPLYCWREEQPLRGSAVAGYVGDMPHNWASAECVRYLRHMLVLEDGGSLRLLPAFDKVTQEYAVSGSPTRFGRVDLQVEPGRMEFAREAGPEPSLVELPLLQGFRCEGAKAAVRNDRILIEPGARKWSARWKA